MMIFNIPHLGGKMASRTSHQALRAVLAVTAVALLAGTSAPGSVDAGVVGLRSAKGQILVCMTTRADHFPDCQDDPQARRMKVPASAAADLKFSGLPSGNYAIALIHDENGNNKLDTFMGIPKEGFGFSRNPVIRFGPPSFNAAQFAVTGGNAVGTSVRVKYML
jgi:uncharacterized protein (DUF2141 family)